LPCSFVAASQPPSLCHAVRTGKTPTSSPQQTPGTVLADSMSILLLNQPVMPSPAWLSYAQHCKGHGNQKRIISTGRWEKKTRQQTVLPILCAGGLPSHSHTKHLTVTAGLQTARIQIDAAIIIPFSSFSFFQTIL